MKYSLLLRVPYLKIAFSVIAATQVNTSLAADFYLTEGRENSQSLSLQSGDAVLLRLEAGNSYTCEIIPPADPSSNAVVWDSAVYRYSDGTPTSVIDNSSRAPSSFSGHRVTFTALFSALHYLPVVQGVPASRNVTVFCENTSLYGGFNTNVNNFNFLELTNLSDQTATGQVRAINYDGTVVISSLSFSIPPGRRFDVDLHTPAGPAKYGTVVVTSDAPPGSLVGTVSQYALSGTNLIQRASNSLKRRKY